MKEIALATQNPHKVREFQEILEPLGFRVVTPADLGVQLEVDETGDSFEENAILKARALWNKGGRIAIADDSGICVDALEGRPGILSARYGGPGLNDKDRALLLVQEMKDKKDRSAHYACAIALVGPNLQETFFGTCEGEITPDYDEEGPYGFGYDPVFYFPPFKERFSQVEPNKKNQVSHRRKALDGLVKFLNTNPF